MPTDKRAKLAEGNYVPSSDDPQLSGFSEGEDTSHLDQESSRHTDDEIAHGQRMKSKKTLKRKRRATEPSHFGATLQSLLNTDAPSGLPLSLKPSVARQKNDAKLEAEARKVIQVERREREERGRIRDVIGGWGGESERSLRKVAQRGGVLDVIYTSALMFLLIYTSFMRVVVKLFNTIQQSQLAAAATEEEAKASRGAGKPSLPTPSLSRKDKGKKNDHKTSMSGWEKQSA